MLKYCKNIESVTLTNFIPNDILYALHIYGKNIKEIVFASCDIDTATGYFDKLCKQRWYTETPFLPKLISLKFTDDDGILQQYRLEYFVTHFQELKRIDTNYVDPFTFIKILLNCRHLVYMGFLTEQSWIGKWKYAYKILAKHANIQEIILGKGYEFDDECCKLFMNKNVCPKLTKLHMNGVPASKSMIKKLKNARKNVNIDLDEYGCYYDS